MSYLIYLANDQGFHYSYQVKIYFKSLISSLEAKIIYFIPGSAYVHKKSHLKEKKLLVLIK